MRKITIRILSLIVLAVTVSCSRDKSMEANSNKVRKVFVAEKSGEAIGNTIVLTEIREGRISNAVEALEYAIDCSVLILGQRTNSDAAIQEQANGTLQIIKGYRQRFPRELQTITNADNSEAVENAKGAQQILDSIKLGE